jgi:dephospho-CoA kinase
LYLVPLYLVPFKTMLRIGITGGIGSGKSTVAHVFEVMGIPVYYADVEAKKMMNEDEELKQQIIQEFGNESYVNGVLNRQHLATIVFADKEKLAVLNALVHPATIRHGIKWMERQKAPYALKEAALIFESGTQEHLDYVIGVSAPLPLRIQRAMQRDKVTREEVLRRMQNQIDEEIKMRLCDFVIKNDEQELVIVQVMALDKRLRELAKERALSLRGEAS